MNQQQRNRYQRQIRLPAMGEAGQQCLLDSRVLIVGLGGLGSPLAFYLAAAGVGHLVLSDYDIVEESNLQRQIIHTQNSIGELKVESAKQRLSAINPDIKITCLSYQLNRNELIEQCDMADVVVDCMDNFPGRFLLNSVCLQTKTPMVSGAAIKQEGQVTTFDPRNNLSPCYNCLYPDGNMEGASCNREGVIAPVVGIIGTMQAQETINVLMGRSALTGKLMILDAENLDWRRISLSKNTSCPTCGC